MQFFVGNAFSLSMLDIKLRLNMRIGVSPLSVAEAINILNLRKEAGVTISSCIGHEDTVAVVNGLLGTQLPMNRVSVKLTDGDQILVAQFSGPRLPEGTRTLPVGAEIQFLLVSVDDY